MPILYTTTLAIDSDRYSEISSRPDQWFIDRVKRVRHDVDWTGAEFKVTRIPPDDCDGSVRIDATWQRSKHASD